ncbi:MAG: choice-of-anchor tandem repeat GloVer-containing protein [Candidatus Korobacteraceae bacterium]
MVRTQKNYGAAIAQIAACLAFLFAAVMAPAQTFTVLHTFTGGADGYAPTSVVSDGAGNLYGDAAYGGNYESSCNYVGTQTGCGVVFKMSHHGSSWIFDPLASFDGANGYDPLQGITIAPNGTLYSTTFYGGPGGPECRSFGPGCGTVVELRPPASFCQSFSCPWTVSDIHQFVGGPSDGQFPELGSLTMDAAGNLYGTTLSGGEYGDGMVYEMSPSGNGWTMSVLYNFGFADIDGIGPEGGVVFDKFGNLYGVAIQGGAGLGTVYQLSPSSSGWNIHLVHSFNYETDGANPLGTPVIDSSGNIYGTTLSYGPNNAGTVWEASPSNGGGWNFSVLYAFAGPGEGSYGGLLMDSAGNLYGATESGGTNGYGTVFKLSPGNGGWSYTSLHDFSEGSDGSGPLSNLSMDSAGNLYGVTGYGGQIGPSCLSGCGVVFEITP